jgi:hypothetical protein
VDLMAFKCRTLKVKPAEPFATSPGYLKGPYVH